MLCFVTIHSTALLALVLCHFGSALLFHRGHIGRLLTRDLFSLYFSMKERVKVFQEKDQTRVFALSSPTPFRAILLKRSKLSGLSAAAGEGIVVMSAPRAWSLSTRRS